MNLFGGNLENSNFFLNQNTRRIDHIRSNSQKQEQTVLEVITKKQEEQIVLEVITKNKNNDLSNQQFQRTFVLENYHSCAFSCRPKHQNKLYYVLDLWEIQIPPKCLKHLPPKPILLTLYDCNLRLQTFPLSRQLPRVFLKSLF